jgi:hypothetical protein
VDALAKIVLISASLLIVLGMVAVLWRELSSQRQRGVHHRGRDVVEVLLPVVGGVGLVVLVWAEYL